LVAAAPAKAQDRVDLVVLLDSSQSMFQYYNQVVDYVLSETVREYMRFGDAFHLLAFSDSTQVEIAQVLRTEKDLRSVVARLYLLYPLGRNTDLVTAIKNVYQYVADLPEGSAKRIILITDGMHSPAPGTTFAELDAQGVRSEIDKAAAKIRERGWTMRIVRVPFSAPSAADASGDASGSTGQPASAGRGGEAAPSAPGSGDYLADVAAAIGSEIQTFDPENASAAVNDSLDLPRLEFPSDLGRKDYSFALPVDVTNRSSRPISLELTGLLLEDGTDILSKKVFAEIQPGKSARLSLKVAIPYSVPEGPARLSLEPRFADGVRASPARSVVSVELKRSALTAIFRNSARVALFLVILVLAGAGVLIAGLYVRRAHRRAEAPIVDAFIDSAAARQKHVSPYETQARADGSAGTPGSSAAGARGVSSAGGTPAAQAAILASAKGSAHARPSLDSVAASSRDSASAQAAVLAAARNAPAASRPATETDVAGRRDNARAASVLGAWGKPAASRRRLPTSSETAYVAPAARREPMHYEPRVVRPGAVRLTLTVAGQNPNIGKRNIRAMHSGRSASVGGGRSDFLIFLLPVPRRIAHLHFDGVDATLVPARPEFFPDYDSPIENCIGKDIRVVTLKGKELLIRFERYVPPIDRINKLLHCLESPGVMALTLAETAQESVTEPEGSAV
jgi:hypothetical protein